MRGRHLLGTTLLVGCSIFDTSGGGSGGGTVDETSGAQGSSSDSATSTETSSSSAETTSTASTAATTGSTSHADTTGTSGLDTDPTNEATTHTPTTGDPDGGRSRAIDLARAAREAYRAAGPAGLAARGDAEHPQRDRDESLPAGEDRHSIRFVGRLFVALRCVAHAPHDSPNAPLETSCAAHGFSDHRSLERRAESFRRSMR